MTRTVDWTDETGRTWRSLLPDDAPEESAPHYSPTGPLDTAGLGLPDQVAVRLHNELHRRSLWSWREVKHRRQDLEAAVRAAFSVTTDGIIALYYTDYQQGVEEAAKEKAQAMTITASRSPSRTAPKKARPAPVASSPRPSSVVSTPAPEEAP